MEIGEAIEVVIVEEPHVPCEGEEVPEPTPTRHGDPRPASEPTLAPGQAAVLSNAFCCDVETGRELARLGLLTRRRDEHPGGDVAFFGPTSAGQACVRRHRLAS